MIADLQRLLVRALRQPDPRQWLQAQVVRADCPLSAEERAMLAALPEDGLRLTRFLVRKLRLQRLVRGDAEAARRSREDPTGLARTFAAYDAEAPARDVFPEDEARSFRRRGAGPLPEANGGQGRD